MAKRDSRSTAHSKIDLDDELTRNPSALSTKHQSVKQDNWRISSEYSQRDANWKKMKLNHDLGSSSSGMWQYTEQNQRYWVEGTNPSIHWFEAFKGDKEISKIYRDYWLTGDELNFVALIYEHDSLLL